MADMKPKWRDKLNEDQGKQADKMLGQLFRMFDRVVTDVPKAVDFETCMVQLLAGTHMIHKMTKDICDHIGLKDITALSDQLSDITGDITAFDDLPEGIKDKVRASMAEHGVKPEDDGVQISVMAVRAPTSEPEHTDAADAFPFNTDTTGRSN